MGLTIRSRLVNLLDRIPQFFTRPPLPIYLFVMNMVILAILFPALTLVFKHGFTNFQEQEQKDYIFQMRHRLEDNIASLMESMLATSGYAIGSYEFYLLQQQVTEVAASDSRVKYLALMDIEGTAVVHTNEQLVLNRLSSQMDKMAFAIIKNNFAVQQPETQQSRVHFFTNEDTSQGVENPIIEGVVPVYSAGKLWGALRCGISLISLQEEIEKRKQKWGQELNRFYFFLYRVMAAAFFLAAISALLFSRVLTRSTTLLANGVEMIAQGDLNQKIDQPLPSCKEFWTLSEGFNRMSTSLRQAKVQLDKYSQSLEYLVKERTQELKAAQAELVSQARDAGMAEMAIGVLHNIGNAITPAKVDIHLLIRNVTNSPMRRNAAKALEPLKDIIAKAEGVSESRKKQLSQLLDLLPKGLEEEFDSISTSLKDVRAKHDHIEEIIRLQMRYARQDDLSETAEINQVIEDALDMLTDSLQKREIKVRVALADATIVKMDHTRLLQIIVNILKNAYEAIDASTHATSGEIYIHSMRDNEFVTITITDNGCGFSPKDKENLFNFGYTTKSEGSGFGLHSTANYLIARDGVINATSEGAEMGAEIAICLPIVGKK